MHPKHFTSKYVEHGKKYEPVALLEYQKFMASRKTPVQVLPSGFVISNSHPVLGASPDAKIADIVLAWQTLNVLKQNLVSHP